MSKALYDIYRKQVFEMAATLVVKHEEVSDAINMELRNRGFVIKTEPYTIPGSESESGQDEVVTVPEMKWKYYQNLEGYYHESDKKALYAAQFKYLNDNYAQYENITLYQDPQAEPGLNDIPFVNIADLAETMWVEAVREIKVWTGSVWDIQLIRFPTAFDKAFVDDPLTAFEYRYGTRLHNDLAARYPEHVMLLNGILNPVPFWQSFRAKNGDILYIGDYVRAVTASGGYYHKLRLDRTRSTMTNYLEDNELSLIVELEQWIKGFLFRWHIKEYMFIDDLYLPSMLGILYMNLPLVIMNIRLANCKTEKAHSYHIRQYLQSHGQLAQYIPLISKKQSLYLYRNVEWIEANVGKQETFEDLVKNLMTDNGLALNRYVARHNLSNLNLSVSDLEDAATGTIPDVDMVRETINLEQVGTGSDNRTVRYILDKEAPLAREGNYNLDEVETLITEQIATGNYSELDTKVLESIAIDLKEQLPFKFTDVLFNNWLYFGYGATESTQAPYRSLVYFTIPGTSVRASLPPGDAFLLFLYAFNKGHCDITLPQIPTIGARMIPRQRFPRIAGLPPSALNNNQYYRYVERARITPTMIAEMRGTIIPEPVNGFNSSTELYNYSVRIHEQMMRRYYHYAGQEDRWVEAQMHFIFFLQYWDSVPCDFAYGETIAYDDWLSERSIDLSSVSPFDLRTLANEILRNATGIGIISDKNLREVQSAVLNIMRQFSSYTVQYIQTIFDEGIDIAGIKTLRISDIEAEGSDMQNVDIGELGVIDQYHRHVQYVDEDNVVHAYERRYAIAATGSTEFTFDVEGGNITDPPDAQGGDEVFIDMSLNPAFAGQANIVMNIGLGSFGVLSLTSDAEELLQALPNTLLDGFLYPPP